MTRLSVFDQACVELARTRFTYRLEISYLRTRYNETIKERMHVQRIRGNIDKNYTISS